MDHRQQHETGDVDAGELNTAAPRFLPRAPAASGKTREEGCTRPLTFKRHSRLADNR